MSNAAVMTLKKARAIGSVVLERTVAELRGEPCIAFEDVEPQRKGMAVTRSVARPMTDFDTVMEALTAHATRAAEKLRQHGLVAGSLTAFYHSSRFKPDKPNHRASRTTTLTPMTNDTFDLVAAARRCAEAAWKDPLSQNIGGYGKKSLVIAREGFAGRTAMRQQFRSPRYTTRISDVPVIRG